MKRFAVLATTGAFVLSCALMGCGSPATQQNAADTSSEEVSVPLDGGWSVNTQANSSLTADEQEVFEKALEGLVGVTYRPIALLGTQLVAGTNYAFLCTGQTADAQATEGWYVVTVYQDLEGAVALTTVEEVDVVNPQVAAEDAAVQELVGAWSVTDAAAAELLPGEAATAFAQATENHLGMTFAPLACLGTQVVAGTNYRVLCVGTAVVPDAQPGLYVVDVYQDLDGNAEITSAQAFDLLSYLGA